MTTHEKLMALARRQDHQKRQEAMQAHANRIDPCWCSPGACTSKCAYCWPQAGAMPHCPAWFDIVPPHRVVV